MRYQEAAGMVVRKTAAVAALVGSLTVSGWTQGKQLTTEDYAQAEKFMGYNVNSLVYHGVARPTWMADGRFWYRDNGPDGITFIVVDPTKGTKAPAFDQAKLAAALTSATDGKMKADAWHLMISEIEFSNGDKTVVVGSGSRKFRCDLSGAGVCTEVVAAGGEQAANKIHGVLAPDKTKEAFIRDWNLWVRDVATGKETQLTTDGVKDYGYATDNAGWTMSDNAVLVWSPDGKMIATFQQDQRKTGEMYMVPVTNGHPELKVWKYPLVGDKDVTMIERVIIDMPGDGKAAKVIRLKMPPDQHRSTLCDDISCRGGSGWDDVQWSADGKTLAFVSTSRDHKQEWMRIADASTGEVLDVMGETATKFFESGNDKVNWKYLSKTNELLWFSERDGWGQMYLYDAATGNLKNKITRGDGNVTQVLQVDEKTRTIYFLGVGKEPGRDPIFHTSIA
ncbi:DPP IV N-terminal domain-containing protein [Tunturiibacter empetritectus]|uniref:DPP IV N-terminal domain-containing protein n=1 Tax=Tunturiibacter empetritectus TaxID=3069691 RepID=UPI003D9B5769